MKTCKIYLMLPLIISTCIMLTAQERETAHATLEHISGNVYQILGGNGSNGGAIIGDGGVLVIDSKMTEESVNQVIKVISSKTGQSIQYLVNTHSDGDHIMGNRFFPPSVTFIAHENCRDDFFKENFGRTSDWGEPQYYPFTPSITFEKSMNVWLGKEKVELHYFGVGHTTGDIVVYHPEEKVAFLGDQYFGGRPQLIHSNKNGNSFNYVETVTKMLETLDAEIFLSGHNGPVGRADVEKHLHAMVERQQKVKALIHKEMNMAQILDQFNENESRLVTSIYNEITQR